MMATRTLPTLSKHQMRKYHLSEADAAKLIERSGGFCGICEGYLRDDVTIDHIKPQSTGGGHWVGNLQLAHRACNASKSNTRTNADYRQTWDGREKRSLN